MYAKKSPEFTLTRPAGNTIGVVILLTALLAGIVVSLALRASTSLGWPAVVAAGVMAGLLTGAVGRASVAWPVHGWRNVGGRAAVVVAVGVIVGELAATVVLFSATSRVLDEQAARRAEASPAVVEASRQFDQDRQARATLVDAVDTARRNRDDALVVARCEYNPSPGCPQTQITGDPGDGPETRTANDFLADAQRELDKASAERDSRVPGLDAQIAGDAQALDRSKQSATTAAETGLGAHWVAMNHYTVSNLGAMVLRFLIVAFFALLSALPLILKVWRGETAQDRHLAAQAQRDRAELDADTAIAVRRAEIRAASEMLWVDRELDSARLAIEAETDIERGRQRRRVLDAVGVRRDARHHDALDDEGLFLPIAAEAEAASMAALPAATPNPAATVENLPAKAGQGAWGAIPAIPDVAGAAARWVRPFVPPIVARAIDTTTHPLRTARQVIEEVEEIGLTLKRTRRMSVVEGADDYHPGPAYEPEAPYVAGPVPQQGWVEAPAAWHHPAAQQPFLAPADYPAELAARDGAPELPRHEGPWQLPPAY